MDVLLQHLEATAQRLPKAQHARLVERFERSQPPRWRSISLDLGAPPAVVLEALGRVLLHDRFVIGKGVDYQRQCVEGALEGDYRATQGWLATVDGPLTARLELTFEVRATVQPDGTLRVAYGRPLRSWVATLEARLQGLLDRTPWGELGLLPSRHNPVLGPGDDLREPVTGNLRDYSGCAALAELGDLVGYDPTARVLPLGIWTFEPDPDAAARRAAPDPAADARRLLYLGTYRTGAQMEHNGTLIIAPQNSGKTELIVRWALAANRAGYSLFIVDVKGNLYQRLAAERLRGRLHYFSTDPALDTGVRFNVLADLRCTSPTDRRTIEQVVAALLPLNQYAQGENFIHGQLSQKWLVAFINLLKLVESYPSEAPEPFDLGDVYELASSEEALSGVLRTLYALEAEHGTDPTQPGAAYWHTELALLIARDLELVPGAPHGQRAPEHTYQGLTVSIQTALRPFSRQGTLAHKVQGPNDFRLDALNEAHQVTLILGAREQDLADAETVLGMTIARLHHVLAERRTLRPHPPRRVLLLLDETRRIRGFDAGRYVTFARDSQAGCVLVYQSISQIKTEAEMVEILENVGTQIYLGGLVGATAQRFIDILPRRIRPTFSRTVATGDSWSTSQQTGQESVPYFTTSELYRLPAGAWPALVYIRDHPSGKPFLVDMDARRLNAALAAAREGNVG